MTYSNTMTGAGTITSIQAGQFEVHIPAGARNVSLLQKGRQGWDPYSILISGYRGSFKGVKVGRGLK